MSSSVRRPGRGRRPFPVAIILSTALATALPWPGSMAAVSAQEHEGHDMTSMTAPPAPSTDAIRIEDDPDAKELRIVLGPIDLPAGANHHTFEQIPVQEGLVPFDLTIRAYRAEVYDGDGNRVPQTVLHHANVLDPNRRELFQPIMLRVLAASHETPPVSVPGWLFGIPMRGGSRFIALTMLHNPTAESYEDVTVHLVLGYERREVLPVYTMLPFHLDTMFPTGSKAFPLPPGESSKSFDASPAVKGMIVGISGHLHQYATRLTLRDLTTGEMLYDVSPTIGENGEIEEIPVLLHRGRGLGALLEPDHVYRVTAFYDNPTGAPIEDGGMGAVAGAFIPLGEWPVSNPTDPLFVQDYEWVLASLSQHGGGDH